MTKKEVEEYELDRTMCKYWWNKHGDLYNICFNGWSKEMKKNHPQMIKAYKKYKKSLLNIEREIKLL